MTIQYNRTILFRLLFMIFSFIYVYSATAQTHYMTLDSINNLRKNSWYTVAYKVPADSIEKWLKKELDINWDYIDKLQPSIIFAVTENIDSMRLANGHYIVVNTNQDIINAEYYYRSNLSVVETVQNNQRLLMLFNNEGKPENNATIYIGKHKLKTINGLAGNYTIKRKIKEDDIITIKTASDTFFLQVEDIRKPYNRRFRIRNLPVIKQGYQLYDKTKRWIENDFERTNYYNKRNNLKGYSLFDKALYKPADTVKAKFWITNFKNQPINKQLEVELSYRYRNTYINKVLDTIKPISEGAYEYSLVITDSMPNDTHYSLKVTTLDKKERQFNSSFKTESYILPDVSAYNASVNKTTLLPGDTLEIQADAKDANGLNLLDANIEVRILTDHIKDFSQFYTFVPDTLYQKVLKLSANEPFKLKIPVDSLPNVDLSFNVEVILRNSNNELKDKQFRIDLFQNYKELKIDELKDSITIDYLVNGISTTTKALIEKELKNSNDISWLQLPARIVKHPLLRNVEISILNEVGQTIISKSINTEKQAQNSVRISRINIGDTIGFIVTNSNKEMMNINVHKSKKVIKTLSTNDSVFVYKIKANSKHLYNINIYSATGSKVTRTSLTNGIFSNLLNVELKHKSVIEPGEKDTLEVRVTDFKNKPQSKVNITAFSQNTQLKNHFNFPELPIVQQYKKYRFRKSVGNFEIGEISLTDLSALKKYKNIGRHLRVDTMLFYQTIFTDSVVTFKTKLSTPEPEIWVQPVLNGKLIDPAYISVNTAPIYYSGLNVIHENSNTVRQGFAKVGIRTKMGLFTIDSLYIQPYYKHIFIINISNDYKPSNSALLQFPDTLMYNEKDMIEKNFLKLESGSWHNNLEVLANGKVFKTGYSNNEQIIGPVRSNSLLHAYKKDEMDFTFHFEPDYRYRLSNKMARLEKIPFFKGRNSIVTNNIKFWQADTISRAPFPYIKKRSVFSGLYFETSYYTYYRNKYNGTLQINWQGDTSIKYTIIVNDDSLLNHKIYAGKPNKVHDLKPGKYSIIGVTYLDGFYSLGNVYIKPFGTTCQRFNLVTRTNKNLLIDSLYDYYLKIRISKNTPSPEPNTENYSPIEKGSIRIFGTVYDKQSKDPLSGVTVIIKEKNKTIALVTDPQGKYSMSFVPGEYKINYQYIGYNTHTETVYAYNNNIHKDAFLTVSSNSLFDEVIVVGYSSQKRSMASASSITVISQALEGKVAGISIEGNSGASREITIRGASSLSGENTPLYVVDGVVVDKLPLGIDESVAEINILKDAAATTIYGARAANGVVIVNTKRNGNSGPVIRTVFRDNGYWAPNQLTDAKGEVKIPVQYPENITSWQNVIYAAKKGGKYGRTFSTTKAFKSIQGLLSTPQFLLTGDSVALVGKAMNYTTDVQNVKSQFSVNGQLINESDLAVSANDAMTKYLGFKAPLKPDTVKTVFSIQTPKGTSDGEQRKIPVLPVGVKESKGSFYLLKEDSTFSFKAAYTNVPINVSIENNVLNVLIDELNSLVDYPYACMEQTASKVRGYLYIKKLSKYIDIPVKLSKRVNEELPKLIDRLLKFQQFNGSWAWWESGEGSSLMTVKVLQAIIQLDSSFHINTAKRNGFLMLQNRLEHPILLSEKLFIMQFLAEQNHVYPYQSFTDTLNTKDLSEYQLWLVANIKQNAGINNDHEIKRLMDKKKSGVLGEWHWGDNHWFWQNNEIATTLLAYKTLKNHPIYKNDVLKIIQYFLRYKSRYQYFRNTVEKADVTEAILNESISITTNNKSNAIVQINNQTFSQFPVYTQIPYAENSTISKSGQGLIYLSMYQNSWNYQPERVDSLFAVTSTFIQNRDTISTSEKSVRLKTGEQATLQVKINAKKYAEYVMVEVPIPANCVFKSKPTTNPYREYFYDKVVLFYEKVNIGEQIITIPLEVRYNGIFTLNPVNVKLMYYPTFFGRENLKTITTEP